MDFKVFLDLSAVHYGIICSVLLAVYLTLDIFTIVWYMICVGIGIYLAPILITKERVHDWITTLSGTDEQQNEPVSVAVSVNVEPKKRRTVSSNIPEIQGPPWELLKMNVRVNEALEELFSSIMDNYVNKWYRGEISNDNAFIGEIQYQIRYACSLAIKETADFDFAEFILDKLVPVAMVHVDRCCIELNQSKEQQVPLSVVEMNVLDKMQDLHFGMASRENELDYLRMVSDFLVETLVDDTRVAGRADDSENPTPGFINKSRPWPSHCIRHFLRELVLSTMLIPLMDFLSNPDTLNSIFLDILDPSGRRSNAANGDSVKTTRFLAKLTECSHNEAPDSLLSLKLSEIVKEPRLLQLFYMYLHDIRGPAHFLDCFLQAHNLHNDVNRLSGHVNKCSDSDSKMLEEVHSDAWQLFSDFIHESAPHRIRFINEVIPVEFHRAIDTKDKNLIKKVTEDVYKELYHRLNYPYVVPFCQSESYLGLLCGLPPDVVELIRGQDDEADLNKRPPAESTFSLSQFRNRLLSVFSNETSGYGSDEEAEAGAPVDEQLDEEEACDVLSDLAKDLNKWIITVPKVEPKKDLSGRVYYVYVISVERMDIPSEANFSDFPLPEISLPTLPTTWTITRNYDEFHILEQKLREFHGINIKLSTLPDKKVYQQKNRSFMDTQRQDFEKFLQTLALQPNLKNSELLYAFLTTEEELLEDQPFVSELNPFKAMSKVPSKLQRERGQHLKPFMLHVLANALAPTSYFSESPVLVKEACSDQSSLQSFSSDLDNPTHFTSKIALDNLLLTQKQANKKPEEYELSNKAVEHMKGASELLMFFLIRTIGLVSDFFISLFIIVQQFFDQMIDKYTKKTVQQIVQAVAEEDVVISIVQALQRAIIEGVPPATDEEKKLRAELIQRRLDQLLDDHVPRLVTSVVGAKTLKQVSHNMIKVTQLPRLNKQLAFVLLDAIVLKIRESNAFTFPIIPKNTSNE